MSTTRVQTSLIVGRPPEVALLVRYFGLYNQSEIKRDETLTLKFR